MIDGTVFISWARHDDGRTLYMGAYFTGTGQTVNCEDLDEKKEDSAATDIVQMASKARRRLDDSIRAENFSNFQNSMISEYIMSLTALIPHSFCLTTFLLSLLSLRLIFFTV